MLRAGILATISVITIGACQSTEPMDTVEYVDLNRFMGDWYVIANIPTSLEKKAHNAVESYSLRDDGTIDTVFTFNKGAFDGPEKRYTPHAVVRDTESNAVWGMQFIWPIRADYRIIYLDDNYQVTVIGRNKRDYVWIMARSPQLADAQIERLKRLVAEVGYDIEKLRMVPQQW